MIAKKINTIYGTARYTKTGTEGDIKLYILTPEQYEQLMKDMGRNKK